jgi:hypothetical protein
MMARPYIRSQSRLKIGTLHAILAEVAQMRSINAESLAESL